MIIPKLQIEPNTCYVLLIAIVIFFFKFGNDRENEIALCEFILFVQMFRSRRLTWVAGTPPAPITQQRARVREGSWPRTQGHGRHVQTASQDPGDWSFLREHRAAMGLGRASWRLQEC